MKIPALWAVFLLLLLNRGSMAQLITPNYDGITHAELIVRDDPRFESLSNEVIKTAGSNDVISTFKHIAVLLQNNSSQPILGYTIRWTATSPSGELSRFSQTFWQTLSLAAMESELASKNRNKVWAAQMAHVVTPGSARLISPFFNLSRHSDVAGFGTPEFSGPADFPKQFLAATSIAVTLDSVVYGDGLCEGDDVFKLCRSISAQLDGIRSLVETVRDQERLGVPAAQILDGLPSLLADGTQHPLRNATTEEWASYGRNVLLQRVLSIRAKNGDSAALNEIHESATSFQVHRKDSPQ
jgi:hypothetical protein